MDGASSKDTARLVLRSHYRLADKPARTFEALRIFLRDEANAAYEALRAGREVVVRVGNRAEMESLALAMRGQGFLVEVTPESALAPQRSCS